MVSNVFLIELVKHCLSWFLCTVNFHVIGSNYCSCSFTKSVVWLVGRQILKMPILCDINISSQEWQKLAVKTFVAAPNKYLYNDTRNTRICGNAVGVFEKVQTLSFHGYACHSQPSIFLTILNRRLSCKLIAFATIFALCPVLVKMTLLWFCYNVHTFLCIIMNRTWMLAFKNTIICKTFTMCFLERYVKS